MPGIRNVTECAQCRSAEGALGTGRPSGSGPAPGIGCLLSTKHPGLREGNGGEPAGLVAAKSEVYPEDSPQIIAS